MSGIVFSKSSGVNDTIYGKSQEPIVAFIESQVETWKERSQIDKIYKVSKTNKPIEKFSYMTSLGNFQPTGEGGAYPQTTKQVGYEQTLEADTWKNSFEITMEMIEDAELGDVKDSAAVFADSFPRTREEYGAAMMMAGDAGSCTFGGVAYSTKTADGVNLFSTAHTSITGGADNQSNLFTNTFSYDALGMVQEHMQNLTDDDGHLLGIMPDTIIIPNNHSLKKAVFSAIGAEGGEPGQSTYGMNYQFGLWNVIIWPYLNPYFSNLNGYTAGDLPWILMDSRYNMLRNGALWRDRLGMTVRSEIASNDNNIWKGRARFVAGFNDWRPFSLAYAHSGGTTLANPL